MRRSPLCLVTFAAISACLATEPASAKQFQRQGGELLIRAGHVFSSRTATIEGPQDFLVRGGRIVEIGTNLVAGDGVELLDLRGCHVTPGLIDVHTHLLLEQGFTDSLENIAARDLAHGDVDRVLTGAARARSYLEAGFTSVRDLGNSGRFLDMALGRGIDDGHLQGPTLYGSGPGLAPAGGQMRPLGTDPHDLVAGEYRIIVSPTDGRAAVREAIAAGASVIKMYAEATPQRTRLSVEEMAAIVSEAKRHGLPVAAHATSDSAIREAVEAGVTSVEHAYDVSDATLALMAERGVWLIPTDPSLEMAIFMTRQWRVPPPEAEVREKLGAYRERMRRARAAGVRIAMGSDLYVAFPEGRGPGALTTLKGYEDAGLTAAQALQTATWNAGELVDPGQIGQLDVGAWADIVAVHNDPSQNLDALRRPVVVVHRGQVAVSNDAASCAAPA